MTTTRKRIIGNETRIPLTIHGVNCEAVRRDGHWEIMPIECAVSRLNRFRHLADLRAAARKANRLETPQPSRPDICTCIGSPATFDVANGAYRCLGCGKLRASTTIAD